MHTKKLLVLLVLALGACRAQNRSSVTILGRAAPSSDTECTYAAGGEFQLGIGTLDVGATYSQFWRYELPLYVNNELVAPTDNSSTTVDSAKSWRAEAAKVRVNPSSYVKDYRPTPALMDIAAENVVPLDGQAIPPGGDSVILAEVVSHELGALLAGSAPPVGEKRRIVLGISLQGHTNDGLFLETGEWYYPVDICQGCLSVPTCTTDAPVLQFSCGGPGQDASAVCVAGQ